MATLLEGIHNGVYIGNKKCLPLIGGKLPNQLILKKDNKIDYIIKNNSILTNYKLYDNSQKIDSTYITARGDYSIPDLDTSKNFLDAYDSDGFVIRSSSQAYTTKLNRTHRDFMVLDHIITFVFTGVVAADFTPSVVCNLGHRKVTTVGVKYTESDHMDIWVGSKYYSIQKTNAYANATLHIKLVEVYENIKFVGYNWNLNINGEDKGMLLDTPISAFDVIRNYNNEYANDSSFIATYTEFSDSPYFDVYYRGKCIDFNYKF